jgi:bifunctional non-homologous end joining protein LigD
VSPASERHEVTVDGRTLSLSNLDKVLYPSTGFTKGQVIDYYARVAPVMLPHLKGRPITLKRYPNGVDATSFYEKNCPKHRPEWMRTVTVTVSAKKAATVSYCLLDEPAALAWTANMAALELHPGLATEDNIGQPTVMVFDLDPGLPANIVQCCQVALWLRDMLSQLDLRSFPKTSGSKGLQVYVPLNSAGVTFDDTRDVSLAMAQVLEKQHPELVVTSQNKELRPKKVLIDWSQNAFHKTTVAVYSLRARERPTCSTPVTWDEVEACLADEDATLLRFQTEAVLERVDEHGDLFADLLTIEQHLPDFGAAAR